MKKLLSLIAVILLCSSGIAEAQSLGCSNIAASSFRRSVKLSATNLSAHGCYTPVQKFSAGSLTLPPNFVYSRTSFATMFDANGNFVNGPHNLVLNSNLNTNFNNNAGGVLTAQNATSYDGTQNAGTLTMSSGGSSGVFSIVTTVVGLPYTIQGAIKNVANISQVLVGEGGQGAVVVNTATCSYTSTYAGTPTYTFQPLGNGWCRYNVTYTATATSAGIVIYNQVGVAGTVLVANMQMQQNPYIVGPGIATNGAAAYGPRFDYGSPGSSTLQGFLLEPNAATNGIRTNTLTGFAAGSPGTLPSGKFSYTPLTGLTQTLSGPTTKNGIVGYTLRVNGTPSGAGSYQIGWETAGNITAATGQYWAFSHYIALTAGSWTGVNNITPDISEYNNSTYLTNSVTVIPTASITSTPTRIFTIRTLNQATTNNILPTTEFNLSGAAVDFTVFMALEQAEQTTNGQPSSPILTYGAVATRNAESVNFPTSPWFNPSNGTYSLKFIPVGVSPTFNSTILSFAGGTTTSLNTLFGTGSANVSQTMINSGTSGGFLTTSNALTAGSLAKIAGNYSSITTFGAVGANNVAPTVSTYTAFPGTYNTANLGAFPGSGSYGVNMWLQNYSYYRQQFSTTGLQSLTQ